MFPPYPHFGSGHHIKIHDYLVGDTIGKGGFGDIRIAFHLHSHNPFAVKLIPKSRLLKCKYGRKIFFNETVLAPLVSHSSLINVIEVADSPSQIFQFMRLAENGNLLQKLRKKQFESKVSIKMVDQLLSAVEYLHAHGIVHRDIKLENILLSKRYDIKLCDFGLASFTFDGQITGNYGSFEYSSPESIKNPSFDGFKADMWSVGVVIYSIFTRKLPFQLPKNAPTEGLSPSALCDFIDYSKAIDLTGIPPPFQEMLTQLLSLNPADRPSATDCRSLLGSGTTQKQKKPPFSMLHEPELTNEASFAIVSKLSQVMHTSHQKLIGQLKEKSMNLQKVIYILLEKQIKAYSLYPNPSSLFQRVFSVNSQPTPALVNQIANSKDEQDSHDRSLVEESLSHVKFETSRIFKANSHDVYEKMHSFLMTNQCCISSPISNTLLVMQHHDSGDMRLEFNCTDQDPNETRSILRLIGESSSSELSMKIMDHMDTIFPHF